MTAAVDAACVCTHQKLKRGRIYATCKISIRVSLTKITTAVDECYYKIRESKSTRIVDVVFVEREFNLKYFNELFE